MTISEQEYQQVKKELVFLTMEKQFGIRRILHQNPIIPVVNITSVNDVEVILDRLIQKNISCIEITLRSEVALNAVDKAIKIKPEGFQIGVGTVISADQVTDCIARKVDFMVSPGISDPLALAFEKSHIPFLPGVMTASEIISATGRGWDTFKLFPFNVAGGINALKSYTPLFPSVKFCPTGWNK